MSTDIEALRASMRSAQVYGKGRYFKEGRYLLEVDKMFYKRSTAEGVTSENIICEFKIIESSNAEMEVGSSVSTVFSFKHVGWLPRLKSLLIALVGVDPDGKIPAAAENAATDCYIALRSDEERTKMGLPENFFHGKRVNAEAIPGKSKKGGDVTNMKWSPVAA